jgi:hypothetical protein
MSDQQRQSEFQRAGAREGAARPAGPGPEALGLERLRVGWLPIWGWALLTGLAVWALYLLTLAPSTAFWDTSEYIATAHILGIPHPPGNPFFVVLGRSWDVALSWTGLPVAVRINALSATVSAASAVFFFLTLVRVWAHWTERRGVLVVAAAVSVLVGATAFTVWYQSNVNAKVYTVSLLFVAALTYLAILWEDVADTPRGDRIVLLVAFLLGLGATNHPMSVLPLVALGVFVLWHRPRTLLRWRLLASGLALAAVGFSLQVFFVPIRSAQNPVINEASPKCQSLVHAALTPLDLVPVVGELVPSSDVCGPLKDALTRQQYGKPPITDRQAPFSAQMGNYAEYFDWQWARDLPPWARTSFTMLFLFLGMWGLWQHWQGDRDSFVYFGALLITVVPLLVFYLNFKYGYSQHMTDIPDFNLHEVRERDYFFIVSFYLWGLYAGTGLVSLWNRLADVLAERRGGPVRAPASGALPALDRTHLVAAPLLLVALLPLVLNWKRADRTGDFSARDWAYNLLQSVEPYGVLFTNGDNDTFPLWYAQEVEGIRQDVTVIVHSYLGTNWYPKQLRDLTRPCPQGVDPKADPTVIVCQRPFDTANAVEPYKQLAIVPPGRSILAAPDSLIDNLPPGEVVQQALDVPFSSHVTGHLPANSIVSHGDLLVYLITRSSLGDRPVYFAATAPPVYESWGLTPQLLRQGLAYKLIDGILEPTTDTVQISRQFGVRWQDVTRSRQLLWDVFNLDYLLKWDVWPEPSTASSIPTQYYLAYLAQAEAERLLDNPDRADEDINRADGFRKLSGMR